jgi:hypothetical protein
MVLLESSYINGQIKDFSGKGTHQDIILSYLSVVAKKKSNAVLRAELIKINFEVTSSWKNL